MCVCVCVLLCVCLLLSVRSGVCVHVCVWCVYVVFVCLVCVCGVSEFFCSCEFICVFVCVSLTEHQ